MEFSTIGTAAGCVAAVAIVVAICWLVRTRYGASRSRSFESGERPPPDMAWETYHREAYGLPPPGVTPPEPPGEDLPATAPAPESAPEPAAPDRDGPRPDFHRDSEA